MTKRNRVGKVFGASVLPHSCEDGICHTPHLFTDGILLPLGENVYTQIEAIKQIELQLLANKQEKQRPATTLENILSILDKTALDAGAK